MEDCRLDTCTELELVVRSVVMQVPDAAVFVASRPSITCSAVGAVEEPVSATQQDLPAVLERRFAVTELTVDPPLVGAVVQVGVTLDGIARLVTELSGVVAESPSAISRLLRAV